MNRLRNALPRGALAAAAFVYCATASAGIVLYQDDNFRGRTYETREAVADLKNAFNDSASSVVVTGEDWEICVDANFRGRCEPLRPGRYARLHSMLLNDMVSSARPVRGHSNGGGNGDDIVLYQDDNFKGSSFASSDEVKDLSKAGFNDRTSSVIVNSGQWEVCSDASYRGQCQTLSPGRYATLRSMQLNDMVSSIHRVRGAGGVRPGHDGGLILFADDNYRGNSYAVNGENGNLKGAGFNDIASSAEVSGGQWQICSDANFRGNCQTLQRGKYASLRALGLNDSVSSARRINNRPGSGNAWGVGNDSDVPQIVTGRNGAQVIVSEDCTVDYDTQGRRVRVSRACDEDEVRRADRAIDTYRRDEAW